MPSALANRINIYLFSFLFEIFTEYRIPLFGAHYFVVVLKLDYEMKEREWHKMMRSSADDWRRNVDTIINWSPYSSETELLQQVITHFLVVLQCLRGQNFGFAFEALMLILNELEVTKS